MACRSCGLQSLRLLPHAGLARSRVRPTSYRSVPHPFQRPRRFHWSRVIVQSLEAWLTLRLLRSPTFNQTVHSLHKRFQQFRHGTPPEEMGGAKIDGGKGFWAHLNDEIKDQLRLDKKTKRPPPPSTPP